MTKRKIQIRKIWFVVLIIGLLIFGWIVIPFVVDVLKRDYILVRTLDWREAYCIQREPSPSEFSIAKYSGFDTCLVECAKYVKMGGEISCTQI